MYTYSNIINEFAHRAICKQSRDILEAKYKMIPDKIQSGIKMPSPDQDTPTQSEVFDLARSVGQSGILLNLPGTHLGWAFTKDFCYHL